MKTTVVTALASGSASDVVGTLAASLPGAFEQAPALIAAFASTAQPLGEVARAVASRFPGSTVLGASTAGEFTERGDAKRSVAMFALSGDYKVYAGMGTHLKDGAENAIAQALDGLPREVHGYPYRTALMLLDPLAGNGEESALIAASLLGDGTRLAGGAAGDDLQMKATHVACGARAESDAVVIALLFSKAPLGVGVCHGHRPLSAPLRVTRASGNVVNELDGRPAWQVWLERTREHAAAHGVDVGRMTADAEGSYLLRYEAGLAAGDEYKIRAPLSRDRDGSISFACGIPEGSVIRITESIPERQVQSAREAARRARAQLGGREPAGALVFDCICRKLILDGDFVRAVQGMSAELGNAPIGGFETYGEIALDAGDMSGFHNTTSVVLAFPR
jgi:methyl-accepting chemotaxis protein